MKKSLVYLSTLLCSLGLFVACGDDDKPVDDWRNLSKTYQVVDNTITIGNSTAPLAGEGRNVTVNVTSAEAATVTLTKIVPDGAAIEIAGVLTKAGDLYSITGETTVNGCKIAVSGSFDADGKLTLKVTRTMSSPITGNWKLEFTQKELMPEEAPGVMMPYVPVYFNVVTGDAATDAQLRALGQMLGAGIASAVTAVDVTFSPEGTFNVTWTKVGETTPTDMPPHVATFVGNILYTVKGGVVYIALDQSIVNLFGMLGELLAGAGIVNVDVAGTINAIMPLTDGYHVLPIAYMQDEPGLDATVFKLEKAQLLTMLQVLGPIFAGGGGQAGLDLGQLLPALSNAQELELGLPFEER